MEGRQPSSRLRKLEDERWLAFALLVPTAVLLGLFIAFEKAVLRRERFNRCLLGNQARPGLPFVRRGRTPGWIGYAHAQPALTISA